MINKTSTSNNTDNIKAIVEIAQQTARPFSVHGVPASLVPSNTQLVLHKDLLQNPVRLKQSVTLDTPESLVDYYNKFANEESVIFCDLRGGSFLAVIDYHEDSILAGWCDHTARYTSPNTPEWTTWKKQNGQWMRQEEFAYFIEANQDEIIQPSGAQMLEVALSLQAKTNVDFRSGVRLDNGQIQLTYNETIEGRAGRDGQIEIPSTIKIGLQLFEGGKGYEIDARFRYRVKDGTLAMRYELIRPHKVHEAAINAVHQHIKEGMAAGALFFGTMDN